MVKGSLNCECSDYSLQTAKTGIATVSVANPNLDGSGTLVSVIIGDSKGTTVKTVKVVATGPTTAGMVRLFIGDGTTYTLQLEMPIPVYPVLACTPTPAPVLSTFEATLELNFNIPNGYSLYASTQNAEEFNIIAEGLYWKYPTTLPNGCCNYMQETASIGTGTVSVANPKTDGSGTIETIFTSAGGHGSKIESILINALQETSEGMIRLFVSPDGTTWTLAQQIWIPPSGQSGSTPSFKIELLEDPFNYLQSGYSIGASTQKAESFGLTIKATDWSYPIS